MERPGPARHPGRAVVLAALHRCGLLSGWGAGPCRSRTRCPPSPSSSAARSARMADRAALADRLRPAAPPASDAVAACADEWLSTRRAAYEDTAAAFHDLRRRELQTWATVLRCGDEDGPLPPLSPPELARLAVSLTDVDIRDALVAWICPGALTLDLVPEMLREQMLEILPAPLRPDDGPGVDPATHSAHCQRLERRLVAVCAALPEAWTRPAADGARVVHLVARRRGADPHRAGAGARGGSRLPPGPAAGADGGPGDPAVRCAGVRRRADRRTPPVYTAGAGHEFQHRAPACWAATLLRGGVPRVMTRPSGWQTASAGPAGPRSSGSHRDRHLRPAPHAVRRPVLRAASRPLGIGTLAPGGGGLAAVGAGGLRDVGHAERRARQRHPRRARPDRRQPRRRTGRTRAPHAGLVGRADRPGPPAGHRPVVRRRQQRARWLPGHDRPLLARPGRAAVGQPVPLRHRPRPGRGRGGASRTPSASPRGRACSAARWAGCARWSGRSTHPDRVRSAVILASGAYATAEQIAWCQPQLLAIRQDPHFHGGDYYDRAAGTGPRPGAGAPDRPRDLPQRARARRPGSGAPPRPASNRSGPVAASPWRATWTTTPTS